MFTYKNPSGIKQLHVFFVSHYQFALMQHCMTKKASEAFLIGVQLPSGSLVIQYPYGKVRGSLD